MQLSYPRVMIDAVGNWMAACDRAGVSPLEEPNGGVTLGGFITPNYISQSNWTRSYSRSAYIDSLPPRDNHHIVTQATAESAQIEMLMSLISPGAISIQSALQHPFSRGRLYINSTNPFDPIVIDPNYFSHPLDMTIMRQGVRMVRDVGGALRELGIVGGETDPGPDVQSDEDLERWLVNGAANTQYHPMGSSAMLPRKWGGVVDSKLKVYGLANVRIVDSSVFPFQFAAHLASATFGLAETASEVFKNESYTVPVNANANDSDPGPQGGGSCTANTGGVAAATVIAALGAALMLF
ncbi:GMC oxidoreductase-domain-containing protein [Coprinopsis sp. MPI-PUGE-AT-0042]|nr:GMC oxidoreductase-domain-containing protein [Coprinopsis sp. MPI-PUGE-AT-0042]